MLPGHQIYAIQDGGISLIKRFSPMLFTMKSDFTKIEDL